MEGEFNSSQVARPDNSTNLRMAQQAERPLSAIRGHSIFCIQTKKRINVSEEFVLEVQAQPGLVLKPSVPPHLIGPPEWMNLKRFLECLEKL